MAELTPMMKQYLEIKEQNKDSILFFRLGDFYEMFGSDARTASRELDLTLTTRDKDKNKSFDEKVPMCGIPYHSSEGYIARLIAKGYKVAICEQTEDPATAKGLVKRDIIRVVTPGTVLDDTSLEADRSNFCAAAWLAEDKAGFAACDISTGQTHATAFSGPDAGVHLLNEVARFSPAEIILNDIAAQDAALRMLTENKLSCHREIREIDGPAARASIAGQFGEKALSDFPADNFAPLLALGNLLHYLHETQKGDLHHIDTLDFYRQGQFMELDISARRNLELTETLRGKEKKGSLLWVLDKTKTAMGARMLRSWLERPLLSVRDIDRRADCVERLVNDTVTREELTLALSGIGDMERLMSRIVYGSAGGRDVVALRAAMEKLPPIKRLLTVFPKGRLQELCRTLDTLDDLAGRIAATLQDEPPFSVREGEFIRDGFHPEVDRLRGILHGGKGLMASMEAQEKEKTGIRTLKIGYNKVFGYYIEVSNSFKDQVPDTYIRKQTLVNGERYITQELKNLESDILHAATKDSLLILDEIGRGTSTFDGMSIARAVLEYCADPKKLGAKTLFATHYHELTDMEHSLPGVQNYNIAVRARGEEIIFLRKIVPGGADRSYGIEVARLAGLPEGVIARAKTILRELESEAGKPPAPMQEEADQVSLSSLAETEVLSRLRREQVDTLSPLEALNLLYELKQKLQ